MVSNVPGVTKPGSNEKDVMEEVREGVNDVRSEGTEVRKGGQVVHVNRSTVDISDTNK